MAHTIGKYQYLLIERSFIGEKQIDEYFEIANTEKLAIQLAEEWERGYNATQVAPNVLRAEFDTGFGTTEIRELVLLSVPVVTSISGVGYVPASKKGSAYILVHTVYDGAISYEDWSAFLRKDDSMLDITKIVLSYQRKGYEVKRYDRDIYKYDFFSDDHQLKASLFLRKVTIYKHDLRRYR